MAEKHVRAVLKQSEIADRLTREVLAVIALHIGANGEPAYPSYRTIAEFVRLNKDDVSKHVRRAQQSGELIAEKRGKYIYYRLNEQSFDWGDEKDNNAVSAPQIKYATEDFVVTQLKNLRDQLLSGLSTELSTLSTGLSLLSDPPEAGVDISKERKTRKEERGKEKKPPNPPLRYPPQLDKPEFLLAWGNWQEHRDERGGRLTHSAMQAQLDEMAEWTLQEAITGLKSAVAGSWSKPFRPKRESDLNGRYQTTQTASDTFAEVFER